MDRRGRLRGLAMTLAMPPLDTLKTIAERFIVGTGLVPVVASEIELYLSGGDPSQDESFLNQITQICREQGVPLERWVRETGARQYEMIFYPLPDPVIAAGCVAALKRILAAQAEAAGLSALFAAKPYDNQPGCGLHIHVSLHDREGRNLFQKSGEEAESDMLLHSVGGLCATMREAMIFFAPYEESYRRFSAQRNTESADADNPLRAYNNAPVNVSWGGNNRTTAIRIPSHSTMPERRRLEHRVAGADADPYLVVAAMLASAHYGLTNKIAPPPKIHGNAFDRQYDLPPLPRSLKEAEESFNGGTLKQYF